MTAAAPGLGADLSPSFEACRRITARHAKSFYFASHALPAVRRRAAYAVYAFCRTVDDAVDRAEGPAEVEAALVRQRTLLDDLEANRFSAREMPWAPAFVSVWRWAEIPRAWFDDLLLGMTLDRGRVRIAGWPELDRYCYHVAGVVGLIMTRVFVRDPDAELLARAKDLGTAMQLTNILRDVGEDFGRDRVYLPADELAAYGVAEADLAAGRVTEGFRSLMRFQVARARDYYLRSEPGIARLPADGARRTVWTMRLVYAAILGEIEKADYRVLDRRARVHLGKKILLAWEARRRSRGGA